MKKPSLEEVKEHFKDALIVESSHTGWKGKINIETIRYEALAGLNFISCNCDNICGIMTLWSEKNGYSKILTYKEPKEETFVISREQIRRLYDMADIQKMTLFKDEIKLLFPSEFVEDKKELVAGKWYKSGISIFNHQESKNSYGFRLGKWQQGNWSTRKEYFTELISEATQEEVEEALKAEAVRRGYKKGNHKCLNSPIVENCLEDVYSFEEGKLWYGGKYANCVFFNGEWSEIIHPKKMTQAEIETELGYLIEIV